MPCRYAMHGDAIADNCALSRLRRDDSENADDAFLLRCGGQQRYRHIRFDVIHADVARVCAFVFKPVPYILRVALCGVQGYGDGYAAMHGSCSGGGFQGDAAALRLLDDVVEVGVHVGIARRVALACDGHQLMVVEFALLEDWKGSGRVGALREGCLRVAACEEHDPQQRDCDECRA